MTDVTFVFPSLREAVGLGAAAGFAGGYMVAESYNHSSNDYGGGGGGDWGGGGDGGGLSE